MATYALISLLPIAYLSDAALYAEVVMASVVIAGVIASYAVSQYQIHELRATVRVLEAKQDSDHDTLVEMRNDITWIRSKLEEM